MSLVDDDKRVVEIASLIAEAKEDEIPAMLVQLQDVIEKHHANSRERRQLRKTIWNYDLLSWCAISLNYDFSKVKNGLQIALSIAAIFCDCCCSIDIDSSQDFKNATLPSAVSSCLKLLRLFQQRIADKIKPSLDQTQPYDELARQMFFHLSSLIMSHPYLCVTLLNASNLLRLVMDEEAGKEFTLQTLSLVLKAVRINKLCVEQMNKSKLQALLDELVYKLTASSDDDVAQTSTTLIVEIIESHPPLIPIIVARFRGLKAVLNRWSGHGFNAKLKRLTGILEAGSLQRARTQREKKAVETIWAYYVGWKTRCRMSKLKRALPQLQQSFRKKRMDRQQDEELQRLSEQQESDRALNAKRSMIASKQRQLDALELVPAGRVTHHIQNTESQAATRIQAHWRAFQQRKAFRKEKVEVKESAAATIIQRAVRSRLSEKVKDVGVEPVAPVGTESLDRTRMKERIEHWQAVHQRRAVPHKEAEDIHRKAQDLFLRHRHKQIGQHKVNHDLTVLLAKIHTEQEILSDLPKLEAASKDDIARLACSASVIRNAAQIEHSRRMKYVVQPWWRQLAHDTQTDLDGW